MRSRRSLRLVLLAFAGVLAVVTVLRAQEISPAPAQQGSPVPAAPAKKAPASAEERGTAADAGAVQAKPATPTAPSPARFEPTEKLRADFDVSFPVDI